MKFNLKNSLVFAAFLPLLTASLLPLLAASPTTPIVVGVPANNGNRNAINGDTTIVLGKEIPDFTLQNVDGRMVSTKDFPKAKGFAVVFTCNHCPFAKLYTQRFNDLHKKYAPLGVPLLAINSMDSLVYEDESFALMQARARAENWAFPYLHDAAQTVGQLFGAEHTPHAFVIWKEKGGKWLVKYAGAIDDNGEEPEKAIPFIGNAIDDLLAGKKVSTPVTESFGCRIIYRE